MSATITLRNPRGGSDMTLVVARILRWRAINVGSCYGASTVISMDDSERPIEFPGDHTAQIRNAVVALASVEDDARTIADLQARVEQLEKAVAKLLQERGV